MQYETWVKAARLNATVAAMGSTAVLEILNAGGTVLVTVPLANPPAPATSTDTVTFTTPVSDTSADASGTPSTARIRTASGGTTVLSGLTVGVAGSGANVILDSATVTAGQTVTFSSATITHAA